MFEAVRAGPESPSTPARLVATAARLGFDGVVLRIPAGTERWIDTGAIGEAYDIDVVVGLDIETDDPARCSGYLGTYRSQTPILTVKGGTGSMNRFAATQGRIDVLSTRRWEPSSIDHVLIRTAADNDVRLEVNLHPILRGTGGTRVRAIRTLGKLVDLITAYDAPFVVTGDPASHLGVRTPRDLQALGGVIGADVEMIEDGLREWDRMMTENRERLDGSVVEAGVRRGRYEP